MAELALRCSNHRCLHVLRVPEAFRGKKVKCRVCGKITYIPYKIKHPVRLALERQTRELVDQALEDKRDYQIVVKRGTAWVT